MNTLCQNFSNFGIIFSIKNVISIDHVVFLSMIMSVG